VSAFLREDAGSKVVPRLGTFNVKPSRPCGRSTPAAMGVGAFVVLEQLCKDFSA